MASLWLSICGPMGPILIRDSECRTAESIEQVAPPELPRLLSQTRFKLPKGCYQRTVSKRRIASRLPIFVTTSQFEQPALLLLRIPSTTTTTTKRKYSAHPANKHLVRSQHQSTTFIDHLQPSQRHEHSTLQEGQPFTTPPHRKSEARSRNLDRHVVEPREIAERQTRPRQGQQRRRR